jgi:NTE family protein
MFNKVGLFLTGGGARGAYQAGVLKAITEICLELGQRRPFEVITGVSSGAINTAYWASHCHDIQQAAYLIVQAWESLSVDRVFETSVFSMTGTGLRWLKGLTLGGLQKGGQIRALLETSPLREYLRNNIPFANIQKNIDEGFIRTVAISALQYTSSKTVTFVQGGEDAPMWKRANRVSRHTPLSTDHVMASSAIPLLFPAVLVEDKYYGDGTLRNMAPLSPCIHLGAEKIIIVGLRKLEEDPLTQKSHARASVARIASVILNSILLDSIDQDIETLTRINHTLALLSEEQRQQTRLKPVELLYIHPSQDVGKMALSEAWRLPKLFRYLLGGLGSLEEASELISYLLFEPNFSRRLVRMGYLDTLAQKEKITAFMQ